MGLVTYLFSVKNSESSSDNVAHATKTSRKMSSSVFGHLFLSLGQLKLFTKLFFAGHSKLLRIK